MGKASVVLLTDLLVIPVRLPSFQNSDGEVSFIDQTSSENTTSSLR